MKTKKGQVWIETVSYTFIVLILIGMVLAFVKPKIEEMQDKAVLDQTLEIMNYIDAKIHETANGAIGNTRIAKFTMKKGKIEVNKGGNASNGDNYPSVTFIFDGARTEYTEPGIEVPIGSIIAKTINKGKNKKIFLNLSYENKYIFEFEEGSEKILTISKSGTPRKIIFRNEGISGEQIDCTGTADCNNNCPASCSDGKDYTRDYCSPTASSGEKCVHKDIRVKILVKKG